MEDQVVKLTQTVQKGGCAAKVAAAELRKILEKVEFPPRPENVMIDGGLFDDAAIVKLTPELALVQTLDFFTPIVDTPKLFGRVAAANALSDVYAMGGTPQTALGILAFPLATLDPDVATQVLQGAVEVLSEAGAALVGGHSIDDDTLKFGLSVTGLVHPDRVWSNQGSKPQDVLILTKAVGTGTLMAGLKNQAYSEADLSEALISMGTLNQVLDLIDSKEALGIHAATDITGFGLAGHAMQMARASQVTFELNFSKIPIFEKALSSLAEGFLTKAHRTNKEYTEASSQVSGDLTEIQKKILYDPQTSGGLLLSVDPNLADGLVKKLKGRFPKVAIIGSVKSKESAAFRVLV